MSKSLFPNASAPIKAGGLTVSGHGGIQSVTPTAAAVPTPAHVAGPNTREICVMEYDPDSGMLHLGMPDGVEAWVDMNAQGADLNTMVQALGDTKLSPHVKLTFANPGKPPKFNSPEEADAWLEENS